MYSHTNILSFDTISGRGGAFRGSSAGGYSSSRSYVSPVQSSYAAQNFTASVSSAGAYQGAYQYGSAAPVWHSGGSVSTRRSSSRSATRSSEAANRATRSHRTDERMNKRSERKRGRASSNQMRSEASQAAQNAQNASSGAASNSAHAQGGRTQSRTRKKKFSLLAIFALLGAARSRSKKARVSRQYIKSGYAFNSPSSASASNGQASRPALYEMNMGRAQKRTFRMSEKKTPHSGFSALGFLGSGAFSILQKLFFSRALMAVCGIVLIGIFLYQPLASYYSETRNLQQLQAEYSALVTYHDALQSDIAYLGTDEGLEDYARYKLGLIQPGEHVANVTNVSSSLPNNAAAEISYASSLQHVKTPDTWYSGVLDVVFGYQG